MITFAPYCYKKLLSSVIMYKTSTRTLIAVQVNFFIQLPTFTCCFHCRITTNHFFHSLLETQYQKTSISASKGYRHRSQIMISFPDNYYNYKRSTMGKKFGNLCIQEILVLRKSSVRSTCFLNTSPIMYAGI